MAQVDQSVTITPSERLSEELLTLVQQLIDAQVDHKIVVFFTTARLTQARL